MCGCQVDFVFVMSEYAWDELKTLLLYDEQAQAYVST